MAMNQSAPASMDGDWDLAALRRRVRSGRHVILSWGLFAGLAASLLILADGRRYRAEAILAVARPDAVLQFDPRFAPAASNPSFPFQVNSLRVYSELLESEGMARLVGNALAEAGYAESMDSRDLLSAVHVEALADGALLRIEATGRTPASAALLAGTWAEVFSAHMALLYGKVAADGVRTARDAAAADLKQAEADLAEGYRRERLASRQATYQALKNAQARRLEAHARLEAAKGDLAALLAAPGAGAAARTASQQLALAALTAGTAPSQTMSLQLALPPVGEAARTDLEALAAQVDGRLAAMKPEGSAEARRLDEAYHDVASAESAVTALRRNRNLAEERYLTLARKADEQAVAETTQAPELRLAGPPATDDRLPWWRYALRLAAAVGLGLLLGLVWVLAVRQSAA